MTEVTTFTFRIVALLLTCTILLSIRAASQQISEPLMAGYHVSLGDGEQMRAVVEGGGGFAVVVFSWEDIEPVPGYHYWARTDAVLRAAEYYNIGVVARLDRPPGWALAEENETGDARAVPWRLDAYAAFVQRVVDRYGARLDGIIAWNEPNLALEWNNQPPNPEAYVDLLRTAYESAKAIDPDLPVLMAGLAFTKGEAGTSPQAVNDLAYLRRVYAAGGGDSFDMLAMHPYGFGQPPNAPPDADTLNMRRLELHREIMEEYGDADKPVWITEMGWRTAAPDPADAWQVVTPRQQANYSVAALEYIAANHPWIQRAAFWELTDQDEYGYALWQGADQASRAYQALGEWGHSFDSAAPNPPVIEPPIEILADDAIIRLGDIDTIHPHWVHLYRGENGASRTWQTEFFLTPGTVDAAVDQPYILRMETMQVDQPTNMVLINDIRLTRLATRPRPDPTSTWSTQEFSVPTELLRPGANVLTIRSGLRNPALQYRWWRWENMQIRNVRLFFTENFAPNSSPALEWQPAPSPGGWAEFNRLRPAGNHGGTATLWATGNRTGQLWEIVQTLDARQQPLIHSVTDRAGASQRLFNDVLISAAGQLAATDGGVMWREEASQPWQPITGAPAAPAFVLRQRGSGYLAGFEEAGLWSATNVAGPWRRVPLTDAPAGLTVLDIVTAPGGMSYIATDRGIYAHSWMRTNLLPSFPTADSDTDLDPGPNIRREAQDDFVSRLYEGRDGELIARSNDQLWLWQEEDAAWALLFPDLAEERQRALLNCCGPGTVVALAEKGLWQREDDGTWQRIDGETFTDLSPVDLLQVDDMRYVATTNGLFYRNSTLPLAEEPWRIAPDLPVTVSDLLIHPDEPTVWGAATPAGIYRSQDAGATWQAISPPWVVRDLAFGSDGRLFAARSDGVARSADTVADAVAWTEAEGMESVLFFNVSPDPQDERRVWAGSWGNNVGVSVDGGASFEPLHNGLETLSVLDVLRHPTPGQYTLATIEGLYRSDDDGASWFKLPGALRHQTVYRLLQTDNGTIWAGAADGLWFSVDYGVTWQQVEAVSGVTIIGLGTWGGADGETWQWAGTEKHGVWLRRVDAPEGAQDPDAGWQFGGLSGYSVYNILLDPSVPPSPRLLAATDGGVMTAILPVSK